MINKVILIGYTGNNPVTTTLSNGIKVTRFSLATSERFTDKTTGEAKESTEWHNVVAWRGLAEVLSNHLNKGALIYVMGKLRTSSYTNKDGVQVYKTEVNADVVKFLSKPQQERVTPRTETPITPPSTNTPPLSPLDGDIDNDLPF